MKIVQTLAQLQQVKSTLGATAFVPTMGNLHAGHIALVTRAKQTQLPVSASIFVNRLQFAPHEDFDSYPRTFDADAHQLEQAGCELLFAPKEADLYPQAQRYRVTPDPALANTLEGEFRPQFFSGVCTVVMKLFCAVQPLVAVFGKKDYQQLKVIERMVAQFSMPIQIIGFDTVREASGLAMSSRNGYLSTGERGAAGLLSDCLQQIGRAVNTAARTVNSYEAITQLETLAMQQLRSAGWVPDYVALRTRHQLQAPSLEQWLQAEPLVVLAAAKLGSTRLIDNLEC